MIPAATPAPLPAPPPGSPAVPRPASRRWLPRRPGPAATLVLAQVGGQLGLVAAVPLLTHLFDPAALGLWQLATAVALALQPVATRRLEFVVPVVEAARMAATLRQGHVGVGLTSALVLLCGAGYELAGGAHGLLVGAMTALSLVSFAWTVLDNARLIRLGRRRQLAVRNLAAGLVTAVLQVGAGWWTHSVLAVCVATLAGRAVAIVATRGGASAPAEQEFRRPDTGSAAGVAAALTANGVLQLPIVLLGALFGTAAAGLLGIAQRVAGVPVALAGQGIAQVCQLALSAALRAGEPVVPVLRRHVRKLALLAVPAAALLATLGPLLAGPLLGARWAGAGPVVAVLAVPFGLQLVVSPALVLLIMLGRERLLLAVQLTRAALVGGAVGACVGAGTGFLVATAAAGVALVLGYLGALAAVARAARGHDAGRRSAVPAASSAPEAVP